MFTRRVKPRLSKRIKGLVWPAMGWRRAGHYLALRILRLSDTHGHDSVAQSIACGMAMSFFPVFGIHAILAAAMAFALRANILIAVVGTVLVPPVALPVVFSLDFLVGRKILKSLGLSGWGSESDFQTHAATGSWTWVSEHFSEFFIPAFVGFLIFCPLVWSAGYMTTHKVMEILRTRYEKKYKVEL